MKSLLQQLKERRLALGLKQNDMLLRVGVSRQQYQRLESKGNPRLDTLELIAKGLNSQVLLIPKEKLNAVFAVLDGTALESAALGHNNPGFAVNEPHTSEKKPPESLSDNPWKNLLGDES